jgi:hypothetical protein
VFGVVIPDSVGLFRSSDQAGLWTRVEGLISMTSATDLKISPDQTHLYVSLLDLGIYRADILVSHVSEHETNLPRRLRLLQNYPNPFNASTVIQFELYEGAEITLSLRDILGRETSVNVQEKKPPGRYNLVLDARTLSTGIYFCRLSTSLGEKAAIKLLLIR